MTAVASSNDYVQKMTLESLQDLAEVDTQYIKENLNKRASKVAVAFVVG